MNETVEHMIAYVEQKERELQASKLSDTKKTTDIVKNIIDELERETSNEDTEN